MSHRDSGKPTGRPLLMESAFQMRKERKMSLGFSNTSGSAFAEILLHSLPDENKRNVSRKEVSCYH